MYNVDLVSVLQHGLQLDSFAPGLWGKEAGKTQDLWMWPVTIETRQVNLTSFKFLPSLRKATTQKQSFKFEAWREAGVTLHQAHDFKTCILVFWRASFQWQITGAGRHSLLVHWSTESTSFSRESFEKEVEGREKKYLVQDNLSLIDLWQSVGNTGIQ